LGIQISMAAIGQPTDNPYAERVIRTIKEEEVYLNEYRDLADARAHLGRFIEEVYHHKRIHSALDYLTPAEFEMQWWQARQPSEILVAGGQ
jgi:transposase InsO family protein